MRHLKSLAVTLSILLVLSVFPVISRADDGITEVPGVKVSIDGRNITFSDVVISSKGKTLLPLSELLASLGVPNDNDHIIWNGTEKSVTIIKDSIKFSIIKCHMAEIQDMDRIVAEDCVDHIIFKISKELIIP